MGSAPKHAGSVGGTTTIRQKALEHVKANPGRTASEVAKAIGAKPASVSSDLFKMLDEGLIERVWQRSAFNREAWCYFVVPSTRRQRALARERQAARDERKRAEEDRLKALEDAYAARKNPTPRYVRDPLGD
jgi:DNA-binding MarR family transcriptional regulator